MVDPDSRKRPMKVRTLLPGGKVDDLAYRCEEQRRNNAAW
jgi:hypothetical protein